MSDLAIDVKGLSKRYRIGVREKYPTLREALVRAASQPLRTVQYWASAQDHEDPAALWALRDIDLEVNQGEVVGIIGRNGVGKSTLLKVLSGITEPTAGYADIYGRVGSLLEVGTGFHMELTGRENIFMNGALLGMRQREIKRKFDEIVAFAEVEKFLDTPVKRYSSGMYMRLAFAVAAYLDPEILIVDEVLAVGDASFQKKCLNKMQDVSQAGRTVLFVSHNMAAITRLCDRAILLDGGRIVQDGLAHLVVHAHLNDGLGTTAAREWLDPLNTPGEQVARLRAVRIRNMERRIADTVDIRAAIAIEVEYDIVAPNYVVAPHFLFRNQDGVCVFSTNDLDLTWRQRPRPTGRYVSTVLIPGNLLAEGMHFVSAGCSVRNPSILQFYEPDVVAFQVVDKSEGDSARGDYAGRIEGVMRPMLNWTTRFTPSAHEHDASAKPCTTPGGRG